MSFLELPNGNWINLAHIICIETEIEENECDALVTWVNKNRTRFKGEDAIALLKTIDKHCISPA